MEDMAGDDRSKEPAAPPKKKSLFNTPTWAKSQEADEGIDFFSRAKELYPMRLAEEERRRQRKLDKQKQDRKRSTASAERKGSSTPEGKRRRISSDRRENSSDSSPNNAPQDDVFSSHEKYPPSTSGGTKSESGEKPPSSPTTLSARYRRDLDTERAAAKNKPAPSGHISLIDSDEDGDTAPAAKKPATEPIDLDGDDNDIFSVLPVPAPLVEPPQEEEDLPSDEEFPELVRRARERERKKEAERLDLEKSFAGQHHGMKPAASPVGDVFQEVMAADIDPAVEILVTSRIEGTKPLMVRRKLAQRLKEVRLSWCDRQIISGQPLTPDVRNSTFLTWNEKRLYDASSCKHLGIKMDSNGTFSSEGGGFDDHGRLHFEAWTEDLFGAYQKHLQSQQERGDDGETPEQEPADTAEKIKLILKAKDAEPLRVKVGTATTVEKMAASFRNDRSIPSDKEVALYFDGEKLDPALQVGETELADLDTVEVHIR